MQHEYNLIAPTMTQTEKKIRVLMPRNYGNILAERTSCHPAYARKVVGQEDTGSYIWPAVLALAEETEQNRKELERRTNKVKKKAA